MALNHNLKVEPYEYQQEGIAFGLEKRCLLIGDEPGLGKCQPLDSIIYTPCGPRKMGHMKVGEHLFGRDGEIYHIEAIYPQGVKPIYMVTFSDGSRTKCTLDHLWNVRDENRRRRNGGWTTKTLDEIIKSGIKLKPSAKRQASGRSAVNKWEIPMCAPVNYPAKEYLIIPPYLMGAFLGDGHLDGSHISFSLPQQKSHIIERISQELHPTIHIGHSVYGVMDRYSLLATNTHSPNRYGRELKRLNMGVSSTKYIPGMYLYGSVQQRMDLLFGLMDTDGSCIKNRTTYHTTSERLACDVKELVQSLGGVAIIRSYDRTRDDKGIEYQVNVRTSFCPFSAESYKSKSWKRNEVFKVTRYIDSVEYIGEQECQCIKVSAPDELYLTDEYIVTHNTLQSIGIVDTANAYPCLVICPSSLKINWQREFEKFTDKKALVLDNSVATTWPYLLQMGMQQVAIVNYESLRKFFVWDILAPKRQPFKLKDVVFNPHIQLFKSVILDESHRLKDPSAHQSVFAKGITEGKDWRILLSGTPVVNRPADLISQLSIMGRLKEFGGRAKFLADYGGGDVKKERSQDTDEPRNLDRLSAELYDRCMIRREKAKVLTQLPDKTRIDLYVDISNRDEYELAAQDLASYLREYTECTDREIKRKMRMEALVKFMTLRSLASKGKVKQAIDFVKTFLANGTPLILFCSLHEIVDEIKKAFPDAVSVTGRDSMQAKQSAVDAFQSGRAKLIICSIKAAGVGLTLTASSNVAFCEFPWTYADCCQCEDRAHRIGQKDNVTCYYLIGRHTIDGALYNIIHRKKSIAQQIMGTDDEIPTDEMYFDQLTDMFLNPNYHD